MREFISNSVAETQEIAKEFGRELKSGDVVAYIGGLGAGKTAFTRGLAEGVGVLGEVSSPTFALVHEYRGEIPLYHFDMYRITSLEDLYSTGFFDYLDAGSILAIEWSENIFDALPDNTVFVDISHILDEDGQTTDKRKIKIYNMSEMSKMSEVEN